MAVFDFSLIDTSPAPPTTEELDRLRLLDGKLQTALAERYAVVESAHAGRRELDPRLQRMRAGRRPRARRATGDLWLGAEGQQPDPQHQPRHRGRARPARCCRADSVDIRSNTDESWSRGLRFLLDERLFRE